MGLKLFGMETPIPTFEEAADWLEGKATEYVDGAKTIVTDLIDQGGQAASTLLPGAAPAIKQVTEGMKSLSKDAIDFLDPVSYAMELTQQGFEMLTPKEMGRRAVALTKGMKTGDWSMAGDVLKDKNLWEAQVAAATVPAGTIAKPVIKPLTRGVKAAKRAVKEIPRGTPERVVAKHKLKTKKRVQKTAKFTVKNAVRAGKQIARDDISSRRAAIRDNIPFQNSRFTVSQRDWSQFGRTTKGKYSSRRND